MTKLTVEQLAKAVRDEGIGFTEALLKHLELRHPEHHSIEAYFVLSMAISYLSMNQPDTVLDLAGEQATAGEWVRRFGLEPFLQNDC